MHLSRFAEEIVLWCTKEFSFIDLDDSLCTGSSLMPQKKNPDPAELLRGKTGRIYGNLINLLTSLKGLPLTYNRDLQEDKPPVFDSVDTIKISLEVAKGLTEGMTVNKQHIALTLEQDDSFLATDLADYLVMKDVPFRQAHHDVGRLVQYCQGKGLRFIDLDIDTFKIFNDRFGSDIKSKLDAKTSVKEKKTIGSTNPDMVHKEIGKWKKILN
jgi:argininosuccinate lyase